MNKTFIIVVIILIISAAISIVSYLPLGMESKFAIKMSDFPKKIGGWVSKDISMDERVYELLETRNVIMRDYTNQDGGMVNFTVVYSQGNRKVSHPPEICLQGAGATVTDKTPIRVTGSIKATKLILEKALTRELVVYWYRAGKINTNDYLKSQFKTAIDGLLRRNTSAALIRVLTVIEDDKQEEALNRIKSFCSLIEPLLDKYVP